MLIWSTKFHTTIARRLNRPLVELFIELYWNDQQYVNLSTKTLPRIVFLYNCKFKYETEERYELCHRSTMKHEYEVLRRDVSKRKTKYGRVFVTTAISMTFISNEAIRNLYENLCVVDFRLLALTMVNHRNYWLHPTNLVRQRHLYYSKKATVTKLHLIPKWPPF